MVPRERIKSKFLCQDADVMPIVDKCIVVGCFVCLDYEKTLIEIILYDVPLVYMSPSFEAVYSYA